MAAVGQAALLGALIWIAAPALTFAQSWPTTVVAQADPARPQTKSNTARPKPTTTGQAAAPSGAKTRKPGETLALDENQRSLIDRVSLYLSTINTLVGDFVQVGPDGSKSAGQFYISKPGRVRFEYNPPNPIDITADGRIVAVRNRNLDTQDIFPLSQTPLRFLLSDRIDLRRETNVVGVYADDIFATIVIEEKQPLIGTSRLMMMFDAKNLQLKQWTVTDAQGFDTTVAVSNLDPSTRPDPGIFTIDTSSKKN
ncbi:MAG TPA: outer-membrane lipoprotein carrier protein LolA [Xanthobacteraceae bacterium]|nr:outer-membrane lipoprotein carrier protein LolA [Xanthobacteraceae bacterium]